MAEDPKTQTVVSLQPNSAYGDGKGGSVPALRVDVVNADQSNPQPTSIEWDHPKLVAVLDLPFKDFLKALPQVRLDVLETREPPEVRAARIKEEHEAAIPALKAEREKLEKETNELAIANTQKREEQAKLAAIDAEFAAFKAKQAEKSAVAEKTPAPIP